MTTTVGALARPTRLQDAPRAYPPWYPGPARCRGSTDYQSEGGAKRLEAIIKEAWRACGVIVPVRIDRQEINLSDEKQHKPMHMVRVELIGGLPGRCG